MSAANQTSGGANYQNSTSANDFKSIKLNQTSAIHTENVDFSVKEELNGKENC